MKINKLLFVMYNAHIGGIQTSLLNLINDIRQKFDCEIDLFLFSQTGEMIDEFSSCCNILPEIKSLAPFGLSFYDAKKRKVGFRKILLTVFSRIFTNKFLIGKYMRRFKLDKSYDIAISYAHNDKKNSAHCGCNSFILNCVKASFKFAFVHGDYIRAGLNVDYYNHELRCFDKVFAVSKACLDQMKDCIQSKNCDFVYNIINKKNIIEMSNFCADFRVPFAEHPVLVTIARISEEKGLDRALKSIHDCKDLQINWIIVGDGPLLKKLKKEYEFDKRIIFIGYKRNPFPFLKMSDYLFLCSRHEAAPMVIDEAKCLNKKIIATDYMSASEQLDENDYVIKNCDANIASDLKLILSNNYKNFIKFYRYNGKTFSSYLETFANEGE